MDISERFRFQVAKSQWLTELSAQLLCCTPTSDWLEYADWWNPILKNPLVVDQGMAIIESAIGSGIEWNEEAVKEYLV